MDRVLKRWVAGGLEDWRTVLLPPGGRIPAVSVGLHRVVLDIWDSSLVLLTSDEVFSMWGSRCVRLALS